MCNVLVELCRLHRQGKLRDMWVQDVPLRTATVIDLTTISSHSVFCVRGKAPGPKPYHATACFSIRGYQKQNTTNRADKRPFFFFFFFFCISFTPTSDKMMSSFSSLRKKIKFIFVKIAWQYTPLVLFFCFFYMGQHTLERAPGHNLSLSHRLEYP